MTVKGIDVSGYQTATYSTAGLGFVFVKATEGTSYINPLHAAQVAHGRAAGLVVGHYHFQRLGDPAAQASYFAAHAGVQPGDLIAVDWEDSGVSCASKDALIKALQARYPKNRVELYCNTTFWKKYDTTSFCGDGLWIAAPSDPDGLPSIQHAWTFQQTGISGTDVDIANFASPAALRAWATSKGAAPAPSKTTTTKEAPMSEAQQINSLYKDLTQIKSLVPDEGTHAAGFYLAHVRQDALQTWNGVVSISDRLTALIKTVDDLGAQVAAIAAIQQKTT